MFDTKNRTSHSNRHRQVGCRLLRVPLLPLFSFLSLLFDHSTHSLLFLFFKTHLTGIPRGIVRFRHFFFPPNCGNVTDSVWWIGVCWRSDVLVDGRLWWRAHLFFEFRFFLSFVWFTAGLGAPVFFWCFFNSVGAPSGGSFICFFCCCCCCCLLLLSWFSSRKERKIPRG